MKRIILIINRRLQFLFILWSIVVCIFAATLISHPQLELTVKENVPDNFFTVETEIINGYLPPHILSFDYNISCGFGGEIYSFKQLDYNTYKLVFTYMAPDNPDFQGLFVASIFIRKIQDRYKCFVLLHRSFNDILPRELDYYTNIDSSSFANFLRKEGFRISSIVTVLKPKFNKLKINKVVIDGSKSVNTLEFFSSIKLISN